ncbi:MAG: DUF1501 domain-containing protein [Sandaracinaceae bacterium]
MKISRRTLLRASLGAAGVGLLDRFGLFGGRAHALDPNAPSRLLSIYVPGGYTPMNLFCPLDAAMISAELPERASTLGEQVFFTPDMVEDLAPSDGGTDPIRVVRTWDPMRPASRDDGFLPLGYAFREHGLHEQLAMVHGIDHNTVAHAAGHIAAMCGVAGPVYRAPAFQAVVANALSERFPDRPLPCVALDPRSVPNPGGLPSAASPTVISTVERIRAKLSDSPDVSPWWQDLNARTSSEVESYAGAPLGAAEETRLERFVRETARRYEGPNAATNDFLGQIHDSLVNVSRLLARDVVSMLEATPGAEHLPETASYGGENVRGYGNRFGFTFGLANGSDGGGYSTVFDGALRLMKADLSSAVHVRLPVFHHDTHSADGQTNNFLKVRADFDAIGRLLGEMKATPSPTRSDRTLLQDTLVVVFSEFARSWWKRGDDHWQHTSAMFAGGGVGQSRSVGGYTIDGMHSAGGVGVPVAVREEDGALHEHAPRVSDFVSTIYRGMGLDWGEFFIPGGYGEILGVRAES